MSWGFQAYPMLPFMNNNMMPSFNNNGYQQQNNWFSQMMAFVMPATSMINAIFNNNQQNQFGVQNNFGNQPNINSIWGLNAFQEPMNSLTNPTVLSSDNMDIWGNQSTVNNTNTSDSYEYTDKKDLPNNIAGQFKSWGQNLSNYEKTLSGESVSEFDFVKNTTGKPVGEKVYKEKLVELAQGEINLDDKNGDNKLNEKEFIESELNAYKNTFNKKDYDQATNVYDENGKLKPGEKAPLTEDKFRTAGLEGTYQKSFKEIDINKDGAISEDELYKAKFELQKSGQEQSLKSVFKTFDLNNDGYIDAKERAAVIAYGDKSKDGDLDGKVNYKKLIATDWTNQDAKPALQTLHKFMFGGS